MKEIISLLFLGMSSVVLGQTIVSTAVTNKVAVIEEFTGVRAPNCPEGHTIAENILSSYPGQVVLMAYHPENSSFTTPYTGDPDFRRSYLDPFYSTPYCGSSRFMPSAFINRRTFLGEKIQSRDMWEARVQTLIAEVSGANIGVSSIFNATTNELTVNVEVYYTSNVTNPNSLYVHLTENDLDATQLTSSGLVSYTQQHTFRENINTDVWGDPITGSTTMGSLFSKTYVFDMSIAISPVDMSKANVVAFIYDNTSEEIYTGATTAVIETQAGVSELNAFLKTNLYPNPTNGSAILSIDSKQQQSISIQMVDAVGKVVSSKDLEVSAGEVIIPLNEDETLKKGVYFVHVSKGNARKTLKLILK